VIQQLVKQELTFRMYALPFKPRPQRETLFEHRPNQSIAVEPKIIAKKHSIPYTICESDKDIDNLCDVYLVLGAGILSRECVTGKKIINCHPGIIPASRGLDSFKWALYEMKPLGITLHYIDGEVDAGKIISVIPTNTYKTDNITTLSRRHYENEIDCLSRFDDFLKRPKNSFPNIEKGEAKMRMPIAIEGELRNLFNNYAERFGS
jgi:phosphoribosylglycinamide formyltransferase-1